MTHRHESFRILGSCARALLYGAASQGQQLFKGERYESVVLHKRVWQHAAGY